MGFCDLRPYNYHPLWRPPLDPKANIRLLYLHPGAGKELRCTLKIETVSTRPNFEALSYVWGSEEKPKYLIVDDYYSLRITTALFNALRDLRLSVTDCDLEPHARVIWADAVCINQDDISELNAQVQIMADIYRGAQQVVTYIGEGTPHTKAAVQLAHAICDHVRAGSDGPFEPNIPGLDQERVNKRTIYNKSDDENPVIEALQSMLDAPWSKRLWMVQESLVNERIVMMCGRNTFPWTLLSEAVLAMSEVQAESHEAGESREVEKSRPEWKLRQLGEKKLKLRQIRNRMPLRTAIQTCHRFSCRDPRDKIYAPLGIATNAEQLKIPVDYGADVSHIYTDAAARFLEAEQNLASLSDIAGPKELDYRLGCQTDSRPRLKIDIDLKKLWLAVAIVDHCASISDVVGIVPTAQKAFDLPWVWGRLDEIDATKRYLDPVDALWRTLIANIADNDRDKPGEIYLSGFHALVEQFEYLLAWIFWQTRGRAPDSLHEFGMARSGVMFHQRERVEYLRTWTRHSHGRVLCITEAGFAGLVPAAVQSGDIVAILRGGRVPVILRPVGDDFIILGEAYIHGMMSGEAFKVVGLGVNFKSVNLL